jgi:type VI secretion system protein ImpL
MIGRVLLSRWFLWPLGGLILSALVWFAGPIVGFGLLDAWWIRLIVIGVIWLIIGIILLVGSLRRRGKEKKLAANIAGADPKDPTAEAIDSQQQQLQERLKAAIADMNKMQAAKGGMTLYELPWYTIIGPPGAGKTTALLNSGLRFPLAERHGAQALQGVGGTRNCDWWFTERAVILDTAGRYTTQDSDSAVDQAGWKHFLGMLKQTRERQPLNGVLVVFGVRELLESSRDQRIAHGRAVRTRLVELQETFGLSLPIYVVLTKLDMIAGFTEFYDDLDNEGREQVLGLTFPLAAGDGDLPQTRFAEMFDRLIERQRTRVLDRLQDERDLARRTLIFGFPPQLASLGQPVDELLKEMFNDSRFAKRLSLRGVYFTSATQSGSPIDRLMGVISQKFGVAQPPPPPQVGKGRGFFLRRLFDDVIFNEAGLVGTDPKVESRLKLIRLGSFGAVAFVLLAALGLWTWSYFDNTSLISRVNAAVDRLEPQIRAAERVPLGEGDPRPILPLLDELRRIPTGYEVTKAGKSEALGLGLGVQDQVSLQTNALYRRALINLLLPRLLVRTQRQLALRIGDPEYAFGALKAYLMLGDAGRFQLKYVDRWLDEDYAAGGLSEADRTALSGHLKALAEEPWNTVTLDRTLIAEARDRVRTLSFAERALNAFEDTQAIKDMPPWRLIDNVGPQLETARRVVLRRSGRQLTEGIPGLYTKSGYYETFLPGMAGMLKEAIDDAWVLGPDNEAQARSGRPREDLIKLYTSKYINHWTELLNDITFTQLSDVRQAAEVLGILADQTSPLRSIYQGVSLQTRLTAPPLPRGAIAAFGPEAEKLAKAAQDRFTQASILAGGGRDPAIIVDQAFRLLHTFTGVENATSSPLLTFLQRLDQLAKRAGAAVPVPGGTGASGGQGGGAGSAGLSLSQLATQLSLETVRLPRFVGDAMKGLTESVSITGQRAAWEELQGVWKAEVLTFCEQTTRGRYPVVRGAGSEIPLGDFGRLFGPTQLIDNFFQNNLKNYIDTTKKPWKPNGPFQISPAALAMLEKAADIKDGFFSGGPIPGVAFSVAPLQVETKGTGLEIDGQKMELDPANMSPAAMQWPRGAGGAKVLGDKGPLNEFTGAWAFLKLFDAATLARRSDDRWEAFLPNGARLEIQWKSLKNPLSARAALNNFQCVPL